MTVSSDISKIVHSYNGAVRDYPYGFKVFKEEHLRVIRFEKDSAGQDLALGTDYVADGLGNDEGGSIHLTAAGAGIFRDGDELVIMRKMPFLQETDYQPHGKFPAETHERILDILTMQDQELREMVGRALLGRENQNSGDDLYSEILQLRDLLLRIISDLQDSKYDFKGAWQPNAAYNKNDVLLGPDGKWWSVREAYVSSDNFETDVAERDLLPYGYELGAAEKNERETWVADTAVAKGEILRLPKPYYPGRKALFLYYQNLVCYPRGLGEENEFEELGADPNELSWEVRVFFDIKPGDKLMQFVAASAFSAALDKAEDATRAAGMSAEAAAKIAVEVGAALLRAEGAADKAAGSEAAAAAQAEAAGNFAGEAAGSADRAAASESGAGAAAEAAEASKEAAQDHEVNAGAFRDGAEAGAAAAASSAEAAKARAAETAESAVAASSAADAAGEALEKARLAADLSEAGAGASAQSASEAAQSVSDAEQSAKNAEFSAQAALDAEAHAALLEASAKQAADAANQDAAASGLSAQAAEEAEAAAKLAAENAQGALAGVRQSAQEAQVAAEGARESETAVADMLSKGFDAAKLTSGTIDPARLPNSARHEEVVVQTDSERFALTTDRVQNGDSVYVEGTEKYYRVIDDSKLNQEAGYRPYSPEIDWANVKNKPIEFTPEKHAASHGAGGSDPLTPQAIGALPVGGKAASAGAADTVPWSGVTNPPTEYNPTPITLADSLGNTNLPTIASGTIQEKIQALRNNVKALFDSMAKAVGLGGTPSTQAFGDAASEGSGLTAARYDHKHKMPAAPTSVSGNAGTATKLAAARSIVGNDNSATSSAAFDGSGNITVGLPVTVTAGTAASTLPTSATTYSLRAWLVARFNSSGQALSAVQLAADRTISLSGDVTGATTFNGTANVSITATIANPAVLHSKLTTAVAVLANVTVPSYVVGSGKLKVYVFGLLCRAGADSSYQYREVGSAGIASTTIQFYDALPVGAELTAIVEP